HRRNFWACYFRKQSCADAKILDRCTQMPASLVITDNKSVVKGIGSSDSHDNSILLDKLLRFRHEIGRHAYLLRQNTNQCSFGKISKQRPKCLIDEVVPDK